MEERDGDRGSMDRGSDDRSILPGKNHISEYLNKQQEEKGYFTSGSSPRGVRSNTGRCTALEGSTTRSEVSRARRVFITEEALEQASELTR